MNFTEETMPQFHLGIAGPTRSHRPQPRGRQRLQPIRNRALEELRAPPLPPFTLSRPTHWLLLPKSAVPEPVRRLFEFIPYGFKAAYDAYQELGASPFSKTRFQPPKHIKIPKHPYYTTSFPATVLKVIRANQILRWRFKHLIHRWRISRLRQANTIDVVTMEVPREPISVVDWPTRTRYIFEATTLFRGIRTSLLNAEELFPTPQTPRNPYTNQPLSYGQLHYALNALRAKGKSHWTTECFRVVAYDIDTFKRRNNTQLRLEALNTMFANPTENAYQDLLYDFIDFAHDDAGIAMERTDVWAWAIDKKHSHERIQLWRSYCYSYYKSLISMPVDEGTRVKLDIMSKTEELVKLPMTDLILLWRARV